MKAPIRVLAFIGKEIQAIFVQPQLLLLLVAGPFIVLLAFGLGYKPLGPNLMTIVVQPPPSDPQQGIEPYLGAVGPPLQVVEVSTDLTAALGRLQARKVDLVVVVPPNIRDTIEAGQSAELAFYHNAIDPTRIGYINAVVDGATSQLNRAILKQAIGEQQASAQDYQQVLQELRSTLGDLQTAVQKGDWQRARQLSQSARLNSGLIASLWLLSADPLTAGPSPAVQMAQDARQLDSALSGTPSNPAALEESIGKMQGNVDSLSQALDRTQNIPPDVLVSPLVWQAKAVSTYLPSYVAYHSPTVLALLIQHLCITLAALSLVDERNAGAIELFRAAPVRPGEILLGKFLAYLLVVAVIGVGLVFVLVYGLHVPVLGNWRWLAAVIAALMADSLSLGFLISALANSRSQAIQMSMLALLGSIFFSGFFVPITDFGIPVRLISYSLPVTYGIEQLRQVALRGEAPQLLYLGPLVAWAVVLGALTVRTFQRLFAGR